MSNKKYVDFVIQKWVLLDAGLGNLHLRGRNDQRKRLPICFLEKDSKQVNERFKKYKVFLWWPSMTQTSSNRFNQKYYKTYKNNSHDLHDVIFQMAMEQIEDNKLKSQKEIHDLQYKNRTIQQENKRLYLENVEVKRKISNHIFADMKNKAELEEVKKQNKILKGEIVAEQESLSELLTEHPNTRNVRNQQGLFTGFKQWRR